MVKPSIFAAERRQVACTSLKLPEYEDAMKEYLQHFRLRYGYGFLGFGWMITPMNDGWRLDPKESKRSIHKSQIYGNLIQLDARFEVIVHIWTSYKNVFQLSAERVFLPKHGPGMCRSPAEVADRLGYLIPGATADAWLARAYDNGSLRLWLQAPNDCQIIRDLNPIFP